MIRRRSAVLATVFALTILPSCATFNRNDIAAKVGTATLTNDELRAMDSSDLVVAAGLSGQANGLLQGDEARTLIRAWIRTQGAEQAGLLAASDAAATEQLVSTDQNLGTAWPSGPRSLQQLLVRLTQIGDLVTAGSLDETTLNAAVQTSTVYVDSRYGRWDPTTASVEPLGS